MSLSKRTLLVIFPVILVSNVLVATTFFMVEKTALFRLEQARLSKEVEQLEAQFKLQLAFNKNFLYSIVSGDTLKQFLTEKNESYRISTLGARLQENIHSLSDDPQKYVSVAIFGPDMTNEYYYENSDDPFAEIAPAQTLLANRLKHTQAIVTWNIIHDERGAMLVHSVFIDPLTFSKPLASQKKSAVLVQTAIRLEDFSKLRSQIESEYGATFTSTFKPEADDDTLSAALTLGPELSMQIVVPPEYLDRSLSRQRTILELGAGLISLFSIALLIGLIRRYITAPVAALDQQVTRVMAGAQTEITELGGSGEVHRLSVNIKEMHKNVMASLNQVQMMSWTDALTGISNRIHFNIVAQQMLEAAGQAGTPMTMLFLDLDNFKFVNDTFGHESGDLLLKEFARRIRTDILAPPKFPFTEGFVFSRLSGDEFAILCPGLPDELAGMLGAIQEMFQDGFPVGGTDFPVTASIGIAAFPEDAADLEALVNKSDKAMYLAKDNGKNQWARYSSALEDKHDREMQILDALRLMVPDHEFRVVYMPIAGRNGDICRCEALVRWHSQTLGEVSPGEFVPIAETSGLFAKIDFWMINSTIRDYPALQAVFGDEIILAINISSAHLQSNDVIHHFFDAIERYGVNPNQIEIELTETFAATNSQKAIAALQQLRDKGFRISIDDFGVGHTSIHQLIHYPADCVKLDMSVVRELTEQRGSGTLRTLISLCHARGMHVTAEGVDTEFKLDVLSHAGCDFFQGYLISKPASLADLAVERLKSVTGRARKAATHDDDLARRQALGAD
jgi:diguanylate cyclase (GGDEF)-like protein